MITLDEAKTHLRVDSGDEDVYIQGLIAVAEEYIAGVITPAPVDGMVQPAPAVNETQKMAAKLMIGHWYEHREAVTEGSAVKVPMAVDMLLAFNRPAESFY